MEATTRVSLEVAAPETMPVLGNLLELYQHDLSECFRVDPGPDGRFGYERLPLYWSEPERRFPFLIRCDSRLAGFALVTLGSPASDDPTVYDVAEFFVLRRYRRVGVGRQAARLLWDRFPGRWFVRVFSRNTKALEFWREVVGAYSGNENISKEWHVFTFQNRRNDVRDS
jgi:predicted acetyltransferase